MLLQRTWSGHNEDGFASVPPQLAVGEKYRGPKETLWVKRKVFPKTMVPILRVYF